MSNISFFIPAYNCAETVTASIKSILDSNFSTGDELIIVNDHSTDNTLEVLHQLEKAHPQICVISHNRNKGGGAARNTAIEHCKNELLFCLDSDNILEKNSVLPLKEYLLKEKAEIAAFQHLYYFSSSTDNIDNIWTLPSGIFTKQDCLSQSFSPGASGNYLFTKSSWLRAGGYPEFSGALDTWGFGLRQLMTNSKMVVLAHTYYYHRLITNSYYLRDAWNRRKSVSLRGLQLLIPFLDHIDERDINYMFSKKGRYIWKENLDKRPIRIVNIPKTAPIWEDHQIEISKFRYYKNRLIDRVKALLK